MWTKRGAIQQHQLRIPVQTKGSGGLGGAHSVGLNSLPNINFLNLKDIGGTHLSDDQTTEALHWKLFKQNVMETF